MIPLVLFASGLISNMRGSASDVVFATTCDGEYAYISLPSSGQPGEMDLGSQYQLKCLPYSGRGNPGGFYRFDAKWDSGKPYDMSGSMSSEIWTMSLANNHILTIDFSTDYRKTAPARLPQLFLSQGTKTYIAELSNASTVVNQWISATKTLTVNDFIEFRPSGNPIGTRIASSHPDFSTNGQTMNFMVGLNAFRTTAGTAGSERLDYDNISITVHTAPNP